jgi:hypothetical protein
LWFSLAGFSGGRVIAPVLGGCQRGGSSNLKAVSLGISCGLATPWSTATEYVRANWATACLMISL